MFGCHVSAWLSFGSLDGYALMKRQSYSIHRSKLLLMVFASFVAYFNPALAQTWTQTSAPSNFWGSIASSADGTKLMGVVNGGLFYKSTNSGASWAPINIITINWCSVASSADGNNLVAGSQNDAIYTSTDSGVNWNYKARPLLFGLHSLASSADGVKLIAGGASVFTSTNAGTTWAITGLPNLVIYQPTNFYNYSVASSADGSKLVVAAFDGSSNIYTSADSGATWMTNHPPGTNWSAIASSADGIKLLLANYYGIYISSNSGVTWAIANTNQSNWVSVACSADGTKLIASAYHGYVATSTNSGITWTTNNSPNATWSSVALSADGSRLISASLTETTPGTIWVSQTTPTPKLNLTPSSNNLIFSWIIPSTNFVMQQSSNLTSWEDLTIAPVLNLTNLQNQVILSPSNSIGFYRLATP